MSDITNDDVTALIDEGYEALIAAEQAHPGSPELAALHKVLKRARDAAVAHFGLGIGARSGGEDKEVDPDEVG